MKIVKTWCENTKEGKDYLEYNGYQPICRLTKDLWLVKRVGNKLNDVEIMQMKQQFSEPGGNSEYYKKDEI